MTAPAKVRALRFWPEPDELEPDDEPWAVAHSREQAAQIAAWEDRPLDPDDDLSIIADYPDEVSRLRRAQDVIRRHPLFRVVERAGSEKRARFLAECLDRDRINDDAAEAFYDDEVCECALRGVLEFADGELVRRRHRDAARCRWCVIRTALEEKQHRELRDETGRAFAAWWRDSATPEQREALRAAGVPAPGGRCA